ncbi:MAG: YdeI/OmpD-associated family protein [Kofleriaceae bacterium]|nr:YdeI/OmpD-associated family protein [Myxococcales bacterium]MCB9562488.1 YdeI/OmpD-associated family protein [Kofleriaceae bacterium]MCB9570753.1 YdeI/OmpD-associated family protein [Kofleriaceae bacterium]
MDAMNTPFGNRGPKPMPGFVRTALAKHKLIGAFRARPEYQRDGYMTWLDGARLPAQRLQRLAQFLDEIGKGDVYMGEPWTPPPPVTK